MPMLLYAVEDRAIVVACAAPRSGPGRPAADHFNGSVPMVAAVAAVAAGASTAGREPSLDARRGAATTGGASSSATIGLFIDFA